MTPDAPTEITLAEYYSRPLPKEDVVFTCVICEQERTIGRWNRDGRSRHLPPICLNCEMWAGNLSSWPGNKMDGRIARQIKSIAERISATAWQQIHRSQHGRET